MINAEKDYSSIAEAIKELSDIYQPIGNIFTEVEEGNDDDLYEIIRSVLLKILDDIPSIFNEEYPNCHSLLVGPRNFVYRFPGNVSFGIFYNIVKNDIVYHASININQPLAIAKNGSVVPECEKYGYKITERENTSSRKK